MGRKGEISPISSIGCLEDLIYKFPGGRGAAPFQNSGILEIKNKIFGPWATGRPD